MSTQHLPPTTWVSVALGGGVGAVLRFVLDTSWIANSGIVVLLVNIAGSLALGLLIATLFARPGQPAWLAPAIGPGLLGGFTTMSGFALWAVESAMQSGPLLGAAYLLGSVAGGLAAAWAGLALGRRLGHRPLPTLMNPELPDES